MYVVNTFKILGFQGITLYSAAVRILVLLCKNGAQRNAQKNQNVRCPLEHLVSALPFNTAR